VRRAACRSLKEAGYTIALDDYVAHDRRVALVEIAGEKIETRAEFVTARDQGFVHFRDIFPGIRRR
jgi:c-di-GMP-related signal transduction protein